MQRNLFSQPTVCSGPAKLFLVSWDKLGSDQAVNRYNNTNTITPASPHSTLHTQTNKVINAGFLASLSGPVICVFYQSTKLSQRARGRLLHSPQESQISIITLASFITKYLLLHHPGRFPKNAKCRVVLDVPQPS